MPRHSIGFLFDPDNDWIEAHFRALPKEFFDAERFAVRTGFAPQAVAGCEVVFLLGYTRLVDQEFLRDHDLVLVVHESDLPRGKGFSPVQWQVEAGESRIPVCLIQATEQADSGPVFARGEMALEGHELFDEIRAIQARATFALIADFLAAYPDVRAEEQTGEESVYPRRTNQNNRLDPHKSLAEQFNTLRVGDNARWPSWFELDGRRYVIKIEKETGSED